MPSTQTQTADYKIESHGTVYLFQPLTAEARAWMEENADGMWYSGALCVDPRYVHGLECALSWDGFLRARE